MTRSTEPATTPGTLYVVATPIGNLADLGERARQTLATVDVIAAEDTRRTGALLRRLGLSRPLVSLHSHNEQARSRQLLARLQAGEDVALVSDAGTPLLSDPGFPLVRAARQAGIRVVPVPGPSAIVAALSVAGIPCQRFAFEGFLPARTGARRAALAALAEEPRTLVFFEAAHRIRASLVDMAAAFGAGREAALARELTKLHEEVLHGTLAELVEALAEHPAREKGEFVVIVAGAPAPPPAVAGDEDAVLRVLLRHLGTRDAAQVAAELTGRPRKALYRRALALAGRGPQQDESPPEA